LIDLETKDVVDILRIYSAFSKDKADDHFSHVPELFIEDQKELSAENSLISDVEFSGDL
jgi:hypothetical protein